MLTLDVTVHRAPAPEEAIDAAIACCVRVVIHQQVEVDPLGPGQHEGLPEVARVQVGRQQHDGEAARVNNLDIAPGHKDN